MHELPSSSPAPLRPVAVVPRGQLAERLAGAVAAGLGVVTFVVAAVALPSLSAVPDLWLTLPGLIATAIAAAVSIGRREVRAYPLWLVGLGLAVAGVVLGWFLVLSIVIGAALVVILILHAVM